MGSTSVVTKKVLLACLLCTLNEVGRQLLRGTSLGVTLRLVSPNHTYKLRENPSTTFHVLFWRHTDTCVSDKACVLQEMRCETSDLS